MTTTDLGESPAGLADQPTESPASCVVDARFRCSSCGACLVHDSCADDDNPVQDGDCADCGACADCISLCAAAR